jgi:arabinofuranosyltransferase
MPFIKGIVLYLIYIIWIGGDFMAGRFFVAPFLISIMIISRTKIKDTKVLYVLFLIIISTGLFSLINTLNDNFSEVDRFGICDERNFYFNNSNLFDGFLGRKMPSLRWVEQGKQAKESNLKFIKQSNIGFYGFFAGPKCYILDELAISNALLARLPSKNIWRIGHFRRRIPCGYDLTLRTGQNKIVNLDLAKYYNKIELITQSDLLSIPRLKTIWEMNTGQFNYLIENYISSNEHNN